MEDSGRSATFAMAMVLAVGLFAFVVLTGLLTGGTPARQVAAPATATATATALPSPLPTLTPRPRPSPTVTATATPSPTPSPTPTPLPLWHTTEIRVPARAMSTLTVPLSRGQMLDGALSVDRDVAFSIVGPAGTAVLDLGRVGGPRTFTLVAADAGNYVLRFDNRYSLLTPKTVALSYRTLDAGAGRLQP